MTVSEQIAAASARSRAARSEATDWDARILLAHALGHGRPLALEPRDPLPQPAVARFEALWNERLRGIPVQHLLGEWDFYGRPFRVDERALVPRPETEGLIDAALSETSHARRVLDLGTGSGILAITFLLERPGARACAIDSSPSALALARENARRHGVSDRLALTGSDWTAALSATARFDLAIANPPYLAARDAETLPRTVCDHDPATALFSGIDGLDAVRALLDELPRFLDAGAPFLFEIGAAQAPSVASEVQRRPAWRLIRTIADLAGHPRVVVLRRRS